MRNTVRVLVADGDVGNQSEVQELLVRNRRFIVTGGTDGVDETRTLVREFQPDLLLVNVDDLANLRDLATSTTETLRGTPIITYSRQPHADAAKEAPGLWIAQHLVIPVGEKELLAAIESALGGPQQTWQVPISNDQPAARDPMTRIVAPQQELTEAAALQTKDQPAAQEPLTPTVAPQQELTEEAALQTVEGKAPLMKRLAELISDWTREPSSSAQEAFLGALAENVCSPAFGEYGRDAVRKGLKTLASRLGGPFIAVLAERDRKPILDVLVRQGDGSWKCSGHFLVGFGADGAVTYLDYRGDETEEHADPERAVSAATEVEDASHQGEDGLASTADLTQITEPRPIAARKTGWSLL